MENSKIEWCHHTFNPWEGCQKAGPGCDNCYAEARNKRFNGGTAVNWGPGAPRQRMSEVNWKLPLRWNRQAAKSGTRPRVFCASLGDVFDNAVSNEWREDLFNLIEVTPNLDWLLLTKRIGNVGNMLPVPFDFDRHYPNVWIGATICNQAEADRDIPKLLEISAAKRFLSMEPLLGPVDLKLGVCPKCLVQHNGLHQSTCSGSSWPMRVYSPKIDWVIVGGESGPNARPMHTDWARILRGQCQAAGVLFFFKQWGEWLPSHLQGNEYISQALELSGVALRSGKYKMLAANESADTLFWKVGKKSAGRLLDGHLWDEVPA
jgi:protein gp37